jgi:dethiobiotin synthetase
MTQRLFITGTDTDAGKTLISAAYLLKAQQQGLTCLGLKPVAAGCERKPSSYLRHNSDALLHQQYSQPAQDYSTHNPIALQAAIAPHIAAQQEQRTLTVDSLMQACQPALRQQPDLLLCEGAGGWLVPLNNAETLADFACALGAPVILVVGMKLGCINHALLSARAIQQSGLALAGWVANQLPPGMTAAQENLQFLQHWFNQQNVPCLGVIPPIDALNCTDKQQLQAVSDCLHWPPGLQL